MSRIGTQACLQPIPSSFLLSLRPGRGTNHSGTDLGVGGDSYVELLIFHELAGERLDLEKAVPRYRRAGRSISVSAVPFGPGTDIWRSCRYSGALLRALDGLAWRYSKVRFL